MADNVTTQTTVATVPAGTVIATDDSGGAHYQVIEIADASTPSQRLAVDSSGRLIVRLQDSGGDEVTVTSGSLNTSAGGGGGDATLSVVRLAQTPTITATTYEDKDAVGGLLTFANAASSSGRAVRVDAVQVSDKAAQNASYGLFLFDRSIAAPTDEAIFDPTDTEITQCVGIVWLPASGGMVLNDNEIISNNNVGLIAKLNGTDLFGVLVSAGSTPTYASTSDITVTVTCTQL